jgi:uncharacterized RDD family membrane protein YckC
MRCRYCGSSNPEGELRCTKCQRRLSAGDAHQAPSTYPVIETAAAPALDLQPRESRPPARPQLAAVNSDSEAGRRNAPPTQPPLFQYREPRKIVGLQEYTGAPQQAPRPRSPEQPRMAHKARAVPGQAAFNFDTPPPPSKPFSREMDRRSDFPVAPLQLRAMAAMFDLGVVLSLLACFFITVRVCLGFIPMAPVFMACYTAGGVLIAAAYKLLFCMFGQVTLGLQGAHLEVVSFDGHRPTSSQRFMRMTSGWVSLASAGMGVLWALADQERLSWHDHISQTFLTHYQPEEE